MPEKFKKKVTESDMVSPFNAPKPAGNPGPDPGGIPVVNPPDPLGILPGGEKKKKD